MLSPNDHWEIDTTSEIWNWMDPKLILFYSVEYVDVYGELSFFEEIILQKENWFSIDLRFHSLSNLKWANNCLYCVGKWIISI